MMVLVKSLVIIQQCIQRITAPSRNRFRQLIRPVIINVVIPTFLAVIFRFLYIRHISALQCKSQAVYYMIVKGQHSREVLLQMIFPAVDVQPSSRVSIRYRTVRTVFFFIWNPGSYTIGLPYKLVRTSSIRCIWFGILVMDKGHIRTHRKFIR